MGKPRLEESLSQVPRIHLKIPGLYLQMKQMKTSQSSFWLHIKLDEKLCLTFPRINDLLVLSPWG